MDAYYLDRAGLQKLREMSQRLFGKPINTINRPDVDTQDVLQAPDAHIVLAPVHGIPPLDQNLTTGTSTSSYALDDVPGHAYCHIFRIDQSTAPGTSTGHVHAKFIRTAKQILVFNITPVFIQANTWLVAVRDRWGRWVVGGTLAGGGGGGGTGFITVRQENSDGTTTDFTDIHVLQFDDEFSVSQLADQIAKVKTKGFTGHKTIVTNLSWNPLTCVLSASYETWRFKDGIMVDDGISTGTGTD